MDRLALEVVAEAPVAEHLEERVVARRATDLLEVVVLAGHAQAALGVDGARVRARLDAPEHVLELDHAAVGEQQRLVARRHEAGAGHDRVPALGEELEEAARISEAGSQGIRASLGDPSGWSGIARECSEAARSRPRLAGPHDATGLARFATIYPGWYEGRTVHIHFKIRTDPDQASGFDFTSQLYFDDSLSDEVFAVEPYASKGERGTRNENDGIFGDGGDQLTLPVEPDGAGGYRTRFEIGLQMTERRGSLCRRWTSSGSSTRSPIPSRTSSRICRGPTS